MAQIGDLFVKLGRGETLSTGEIDTLRFEMNRVQYAVGAIGSVMSPTGGLDGNVFRNSGGFSILPHESASLYFDTQEIANNSWVTPTVLATSGATWQQGFRIDTTNGRIYVTGVPRQTVLLSVLWAYWADNATGQRGLAWLSDDTSARYNIRSAFTPVLASQMGNEITHVRRVATAETYYYLRVFQNSGAPLNLVSALLTVTRLR